MPMPALNIMATQETVRNSGSSPSAPRWILPYRLAASHRANTTKPEAASMKAQPPLWISPLSALAETSSSESVQTAPQRTIARVSAALTPITTRSVCGRPRPGSPVSEPGSGPAVSLSLSWSCVTGGTFHRADAAAYALPAMPLPRQTRYSPLPQHASVSLRARSSPAVVRVRCPGTRGAAILLPMTTDTEGSPRRTGAAPGQDGEDPARRVGRYGGEHLARLALIEELQRQGMTLAAIERYLSRLPADLTVRELALQRAVVASWAPDTVETVPRAELERRAGRELSEEDLRRLAAVGVAEPDGDAFRVDTGLLRLGVELLDVPLAQETVRAARAVLVEHSRAAARALSELLRDAVAEQDARDVRSLSAHMHPLVVQALLTSFQRSLREELREWLDEQ